MAVAVRWSEIKSTLRKSGGEDSVAHVISVVVTRNSLFKVVRIFYKPPVKRTEEDIAYATAFLWENRVRFSFFRSKSRPAIEALCRVMGALVCTAGHLVYDVGVSVPVH
jgi:hypothetical protein